MRRAFSSGWPNVGHCFQVFHAAHDFITIDFPSFFSRCCGGTTQTICPVSVDGTNRSGSGVFTYLLSLSSASVQPWSDKSAYFPQELV